MKTKSIITIVMCVALAASLAVAYAPAAFAASSNSQALTVGTANVKAQAKKKATPKPNKVRSLKVASNKAGKATITWKAPKKVKGVKVKSYTVRYAYNKAMKSAKTKTVKTKKLTLSKLKQGKKLYVQIRTNAKYGKKTVRSGWSNVKAVKVKKAAVNNLFAAFQPYCRLNILGNTKDKTGANINAVSVKWDCDKVWSNGIFRVEYSYDKSMKNAKAVFVSADKWHDEVYSYTGMPLKNLTKGKTLYVRIKQGSPISSAIGETNAYLESPWSNTASIKIPSKWIKEQGHWEPVYTTVVDQKAYTTTTRLYFTQDGWSGTDRDEARTHQLEVGGHVWWDDIVEEHPAVTHQEQTGQRWVIDTPGHWE